MTIKFFFIEALVIEPVIAGSLIAAIILIYLIKRGYDHAKYKMELTYKQGRYV